MTTRRTDPSSGPVFWSAPEMWLDETVFVIGGGPSLLGMDLSPIHSRPVIGVNNAYALGPWIDVTFFGDPGWWVHNKQTAMAHPNIIITSNKGKQVAQYMRYAPRLKVMRRHTRNGLYFGRDGLAWNKNSGASAINLAILFGAKKVVLLGFDMKSDLEKGFHAGHNWHAEHAKHSVKPPRDNIYRTRFLPPFREIQRDINQFNAKNGRQIEILNATPGSALDTFPRTTLNIIAMEESL